jgi:hypothetical protein
VTAFNDRIAAQFRAGAGYADGSGDRLVTTHSRGAGTDAERINLSPAFRQYRQRAGRRLPIFRLTPQIEGEQ